MAAVKNNPLALEYASDELKDDKQVVIMSVLGDPRAL